MNEHLRIIKGLEMLLSNDQYLLSIPTSERSITHKLGEYYQRLFYEWNVDCEYNKNLNNPKGITINPQEFIHKMANYLESQYVRDDTSNLLKNEFTIDELKSLEKDLRKKTT